MGEFGRCFEKIYPPELELKKEHDGEEEVSFLDLKIELKRRSFQTSLLNISS